MTRPLAFEEDPLARGQGPVDRTGNSGLAFKTVFAREPGDDGVAFPPEADAADLVQLPLVKGIVRKADAALVQGARKADLPALAGDLAIPKA